MTKQIQTLLQNILFICLSMHASIHPTHTRIYLGLCYHDVFHDRQPNWLIILQLHTDDLVASDLAMLLVRDRWLPGNTNGCGVHWFYLHFPRWSTGHWKAHEKISSETTALLLGWRRHTFCCTHHPRLQSRIHSRVNGKYPWLYCWTKLSCYSRRGIRRCKALCRLLVPTQPNTYISMSGHITGTMGT